MERELCERVKEASENGLSSKGMLRLGQIIYNHQLIFQLRLGSEGLASIPPKKIALDPAKKAVEVKVHMYPADQRELLDAYFDKFVKMSFHKFVHKHLGRRPHT